MATDKHGPEGWDSMVSRGKIIHAVGYNAAEVPDEIGVSNHASEFAKLSSKAKTRWPCFVIKEPTP